MNGIRVHSDPSFRETTTQEEEEEEEEEEEGVHTTNSPKHPKFSMLVCTNTYIDLHIGTAHNI